MRYDSLELLSCPACKGALSCEGEFKNGVIREGHLYCRRCNQGYPVEKSIPRFVTPEKLRGLNKGFERAYHRLSSVYDSAFTRAYLLRSFWPSSGEEKARMEVIERLEVRKDSRVVETGIGTGDNLPHLVRHAPGIQVYGLDMSAGMLAQCVRNMKKWRCEADLFLGNAEALPFRDESFDAVLHVGGINFFAEKRKAVEEMVRVAKPGARIVIACETEKAIKSNRIGIRLVFGKRLMEKMVEFRHKDMRTLIPENMSGIRFEQIWEGNGYLLEFRKPSGT
jgi:ubiquinone/menaquinone biosynthesis C-methylase UbiE